MEDSTMQLGFWNQLCHDQAKTQKKWKLPSVSYEPGWILGCWFHLKEQRVLFGWVYAGTASPNFSIQKPSACSASMSTRVQIPSIHTKKPNVAMCIRNPGLGLGEEYRSRQIPRSHWQGSLASDGPREAAGHWPSCPSSWSGQYLIWDSQFLGTVMLGWVFWDVCPTWFNLLLA